ncbi:MAG TPA: DUF4382 domain-containing protein [Gemmatimonadales bacterium]
MNTKTLITRGIATLSLAALGACSSTLGIDATGNLAMTLQRADSSTSSLFPASPDSSTPNRSVSPDTVSSFRVTITSVAMLHSALDSAHAGQWTTVQLRSPVTIDLMALPTDSGRLFARGTVEAGNYVRVRLIVAQPQISFKGSLGFGIGQTLQGNTDYAVALQGASSDIEAAANVQVSGSASAGSNSELHLVFDQNASLGSVSIGTNGTVLLSAVIDGQ